jgi:hypothetical protein
MTLFGASIVDWKTLGQVVLYSLGAGVGVAICFSLAILGATRFADARRGPGGRPVAAAAYAAMATLGLAATVGAIVVGIVVMAAK